MLPKKVNRAVQAVSGWLGLLPLYGILTGGFGLLAKHVTWLGKLNVAESIVVGLGAALVTLLIGSLTLWFAAGAWRRFRPLPPPDDSEPFVIPILDDDEIERRKRLNEAWEATRDLDERDKVLRREIRVVSDYGAGMAAGFHALQKDEAINRDVAIGLLAKEHAGYISEIRAEARESARLLAAIALRELAEFRIGQLAERVDQVDAAWTNLVRVLKDSRPFTHGDWRADFGTAEQGWQESIREIEMLRQDATGEWLEFRQHPNYTRNPQAPAGGEEDVGDPAKRQEYRRLVDERESVREAVARFNDTLRGTVNQATNQVMTYTVGKAL